MRDVIVQTLQTEGARAVETAMQDRLDRNLQTNGRRMPRKKPATIKAYARRGYDTEHFLVRTGTATMIRRKKTPKGVVVYPLDPQRVLKHHVTNHAQAGPKARVQWFEMYGALENKIVKQVRDRVARALKNG